MAKKFARFGSWGGLHGGYSPEATVAENDKLTALLSEFKVWFASVNGFGDYLRNFFTHYQTYFNAFSEEHALVYTQLHKEFSMNLEQSIDQWLHLKGLGEEDFGKMLQLAKVRGDGNADEIGGTLLGMMDYQLWISSIFVLKQNQQIAGLLAETELQAELPQETPQAEQQQQQQQQQQQHVQVLSVALPEGVLPGQQLEVSCPDGQAVTVVVPDGLCPGQVFNVNYVPIAAM